MAYRESDHEPPYDPHISSPAAGRYSRTSPGVIESPGAGASAGPSALPGGIPAIDKIRPDIKNTLAQLKSNAITLDTRSNRIDDMAGKVDELDRNTQSYRSITKRIKNREWWRSKKLTCWIIVGIIVLLIVIIVPSVIATRNK